MCLGECHKKEKHIEGELPVENESNKARVFAAL